MANIAKPQWEAKIFLEMSSRLISDDNCPSSSCHHFRELGAESLCNNQLVLFLYSILENTFITGMKNMKEDMKNNGRWMIDDGKDLKCSTTRWSSSPWVLLVLLTLCFWMTYFLFSWWFAVIYIWPCEWINYVRDNRKVYRG